MAPPDPVSDPASPVPADPAAAPAPAAPRSPSPGGRPSSGCPAGAASLTGERFRGDPNDFYATLRERHGPVAPVELDGGVPAWLVLGYAELLEVVRDSTTFARDSRYWRDWRTGRVPPDWPLMGMVTYRNSLLHTDGPYHLRRQAAVADSLARIDQRRLRHFTERAADELIAAFVRDGSADLIGQYAQPLPLLALGRILGMPEEEAAVLVGALNTPRGGEPGAADGAGAAESPGGDGALKAQMRFFLAMQQLVTERQARPGADLPSWMLAHEAGLTPEEVLEDLLVVITFGHRSTADWIGNTLRVLLTDRRFHASVAAGRRTVSEALDLVLWQDPPTQLVAGRWATRDTVLAGTRLRAGDFLVLGPAAANADPAVRPSGEQLAGNRAHLAWGAGPHGCPHPAQNLARMLALIAVETVLDRVPDMAPAAPAAPPAWRPSPWARGLTSLPVLFAAARPGADAGAGAGDVGGGPPDPGAGAGGAGSGGAAAEGGAAARPRPSRWSFPTRPWRQGRR